MLSMMMIAFPVLMLLTFIVFRFIGDHTPRQMLGTFNLLWLPAWLGSAFNIFRLRQFFLAIPAYHGEAARIDGTQRTGNRLAHHATALTSRAGARRDLHIHGIIERLPGPADLPAAPKQYALSLGLQAL